MGLGGVGEDRGWLIALHWSTGLFKASFEADVLWHTYCAVLRSTHRQPTPVGPPTCVFIGTPCPRSSSLAFFLVPD